MQWKYYPCSGAHLRVMFGMLISPTVVHAMVGIARCEEATHRAVVEVQHDCQ